MNDSQRRYHERNERVKQFGIDNSPDFTGFPATKFTELGTLVDECEDLGAEQQLGVGMSGSELEQKDTARELLRDQMSTISFTAKSMEYEFDGISELFRFQRNMTDMDMLNRARAFITAANTWEDQFKEYGLPNTWVADLTNAADAFEASMGSTDTAVGERIEAGANLAAKIRAANVIVRVLDAPVQNKYANNPGKRAAWLAAIHVEKAPSHPTP